MDSFLQKYQRQPKLFIDLPSKGKFYDETVLDGGQFNQIPVFGMNAMDEIMFKTPDALFSGEATAQVIRSCIPTILDPWKLVGFDIDYVLIAIRIATYGDDMTINTKCPSCSETTENSLSLTKMIQNYESYELNYDFTLGDLTFHLRPITYKQMTDFSVENYTNERTLIQIAKSDLTDDEKNKQTKEIFYKSNELNLLVAISYVEYVTDGENKESNVETITQFVVNNDAEFYNALKNGIFELSNRWRIPDLQVICANEECGKEYSTKVDLDYSNFFGLKFLHSRNLIS